MNNNSTINIFVPELVPLQNKGEEAIVRGIGSVISRSAEKKYIIHLLDEVEKIEDRGDIVVYPISWFMPRWVNREFGFGYTYEHFVNCCSSVLRNILHKVWPSWIYRAPRRLNKLVRELETCVSKNEDSMAYPGLIRLSSVDHIVVGHDGALDEWVCHILNIVPEVLDVKFGIFGVEYPLSFKSSKISNLMNKTLSNARYAYCRTVASQGVSEMYFPSIAAEVAPDPAFSMPYLEEIDQAKELLEVYKIPDQFIVVTTCETGPIARYAFNKASDSPSKRRMHREFLADLFSEIITTHKMPLVFLPHALGPGKSLNDIYIASEVISRIPQELQKFCYLMDEDIGAQRLKAIISLSEFLIGERIHSLIGCVSTGTPFMCLGSSADRRIRGIIAETINAKKSIYYLDDPSLIEAKNCFDALWISRGQAKSSLESLAVENESRHSQIGRIIASEL